MTFEAGCVDFAVTAYRANPELLSALLASEAFETKSCT